MIAAYDLFYWQPSFCTVVFLMAAEYERRKRFAHGIKDSERIDIELWDSERRHKGWPRTKEETDACISRIFMPMCSLLPSVTSIKSRPPVQSFEMLSYDGCFTLGHKFNAKLFIEAYSAGVRPLRAQAYSLPPQTGVFQSDRPVVTITLRECGVKHWAVRDSNVEVWRKAAMELNNHYHVVVLRDFDKASKPLAGCYIYPEGSTVLKARAALYQQADLNVFVNNGPAYLSLALDAPTLIFKPTCEEAGKSHNEASMAEAGIIRGHQILGAPAHQRMCWLDETPDNIVSAVAQMFDVSTYSPNFADRAVCKTPSAVVG